MTGPLLSSSWYRVARLKPRIRRHAQFHRHRYRGQLWYVLEDHSTGRCHRLTPAAYQLAGLMNGARSVQEIWDLANTRLGDDGPTQDETIRLLGLLHSADALQCDVSPDTLELLRRCRRRDRGEGWRRFAYPLAVRIPLVDPDEFLERWVPWVRPLFSRSGAVASGLIVAAAGFLAAEHWGALHADASRQLLEPRNLLLLWIIFPIVKTLHEFGHAFATKVWGGEVHEMGVMFLVLMPIPYVDASSSSAFPDKWRRVVVGAAGIIVDLLLASVALVIWLGVEPGLVRSIAYNVIWIGGASTLLFNGNPLLRFDGYYVLADAVEIPNLGNRSTEYLAYLVLHHLFGLDNTRYPVNARGEAVWFVAYGIASFVYRLAVLLAIAIFVSGKFFILGVLLALAAVGVQVVLPLIRRLHFLLASPRLSEKRSRAIAAASGLAAAAAALLLLVPLPLSTRAQGVIWPPEGTQVRARADGFVVRLLAQPDALVKAGQPLILTREPSLEAQVSLLEAQQRELRAKHHALRRSDLVRAQIVLEEIQAVEASLARAREKAGDMMIRSPAEGSFVVPGGSDLAGRFVRQGELVGYVIGPSIPTIRVVVPQIDVALVRDRTEGVQVRLSGELGRGLAATVLREVPAATDRLPSRALGTAGGGLLAVDPGDPEGLRVLETVFQLDVTLLEAAPAREIGRRAYVRFDHGSEPLAIRAYRGLQRLFLRRIGV